jgi:hypothetical protein
VYGYDITSNNASNHLCSFTSDPLYSAGLTVIVQSIDGVTVPNVDVVMDYEIDLMPVYPVDLRD